jgi:hypothetical protein
MRIRQIKPAFWTDKLMARLPKSTRLAFIGLWMLADDAGWIESFDVEQAAAELYPWEPVKRRERELSVDVERLIEAGRVVRSDCGCIQVPHLAEHQRVSGVRSFRARDAHAKHLPLSTKQSPLSDSPGTVGNGRERNVTERNGSARAHDNEDGRGGRLKERLGEYADLVKPRSQPVNPDDFGTMPRVVGQGDTEHEDMLGSSEEGAS